MKTVEYRVRPVVRFVITRFEAESSPDGRGTTGSEVMGEFANEAQANRVCIMLRDAEGMHTSDCAVHNMPAMPAGPCDCGAVKA